MVTRALEHTLAEALQSKTGTAIASLRFTPVGGGSINQTWQVHTNTGETFFCKVNSLLEYPGLFQRERQGLELLDAQQRIRTPQVMAAGETEQYQWLLLEWIEQGLKTPAFWRLFGEQLAALHGVSASLFGLDTSNYMGSLVQYNQQTNNWCDFFREQRLEPQVRMAVNNRLLPEQYVRHFERLYTKLPHIFPAVPPSLLHGDLWSGNYLCDAGGRPVLIDPAVYYGHSSVDLAMTTLFGGFDPVFYDSYHHYRPFPANYREQWEIANLYPLLIHLNLFGAGYLGDILHTVRRF